MSQVSLRRLSTDEIDRGFGRKSAVDLSEFMDALGELTIGEGAEVELDGMSLRTVRRRMNTSAKKLGLMLKWGKRGTDFDTHFVVRSAGSKAKSNGQNGHSYAPMPVASTPVGMDAPIPVAPPKRRGRPAKAQNIGVPVPKPVGRRGRPRRELVTA